VIRWLIVAIVACNSRTEPAPASVAVDARVADAAIADAPALPVPDAAESPRVLAMNLAAELRKTGALIHHLGADLLVVDDAQLLRRVSHRRAIEVVDTVSRLLVDPMRAAPHCFGRDPSYLCTQITRNSANGERVFLSYCRSDRWTLRAVAITISGINARLIGRDGCS